MRRRIRVDPRERRDREPAVAIDRAVDLEAADRERGRPRRAAGRSPHGRDRSGPAHGALGAAGAGGSRSSVRVAEPRCDRQRQADDRAGRGRHRCTGSPPGSRENSPLVSITPPIAAASTPTVNVARLARVVISIAVRCADDLVGRAVEWLDEPQPTRRGEDQGRGGARPRRRGEPRAGWRSAA